MEKKCCRNIISSTTDQQKCGRYWNQGISDCGDLGCTGDELKNNTVCQTWCNKNPIQCNTIKINHCLQHPDDSYCGCINDTEKARLERSRYPSIVAPRKCWSGSDCQKTDLVNTFITTDLKPFGCPDINSQIIEIKNSGLMLGNELDQGINGEKSSTNWLLWLLLIIIILVIVGGITYILYGLED